MIIDSSPGIALNSRNSFPPHNVNRSSSLPSISDVQSNNNSNKSNLIASDNHFVNTSDALYSIRTLNSIPGSINNKLVILSFDDNRKGDFTYAKPILDKYGFKATFFIICGKTSDRGAMNWHDIAVMQKDGMDIESHTMTHLNTLSRSQLDFEMVAQNNA